MTVVISCSQFSFVIVPVLMSFSVSLRLAVLTQHRLVKDTLDNSTYRANIALRDKNGNTFRYYQLFSVK